MEAYGRDLADLADTLGGTASGLLELARIRSGALFAALNERGLSPATTQRKRSAVRQFYRFCVAENLTGADPTRKIAAPRRA